jgi:hypothetical protein|tara:strand:- start:400 stop:651 length:252 start_codon:yes stop_codon:yes gene_type:complete
MGIPRAKIVDNSISIKLVDMGTGEVIKPTKEDIIHIIEDFIVDSTQEDKERIEVLEDKLNEVEDVADNLIKYVKELRNIFESV